MKKVNGGFNIVHAVTGKCLGAAGEKDAAQTISDGDTGKGLKVCSKIGAHDY